MNDKKSGWQAHSVEPHETFFRLIKPEAYGQHGIDAQDVPMGTFASEDHPSFLPSRFGGNAYGLGLMEQSVLNRGDTDFLESVNFQDPSEVGRNARRLNTIYQKLGLLIRFSNLGKPYFLIPINLVAHSLQEIKTKADEIEELIIQHIFDTRTERLDIGILSSGHDLLVHELTARLTSHRIFLFESIEKLRSWRLRMDIIILPKDPFELLLEQQLPRSIRSPMSRKRLLNYAMYVAGKILDLLEPHGKLHVLAHSPGPQEDKTCRVRFKSDEDLKYFLLFSHTFKTKRKYEGTSVQETMDIHVSDFHYYLNRFAFFDPYLKGLLADHKPGELSIEEINRLPYLGLRLPRKYIKDPEKQWKIVFEPYFQTRVLKRKSPRRQHQYWEERLEMDRDLPEGIFVYVGSPRQPSVDLHGLEEEVRESGVQGCPLPLVAEYRNSFGYVLDVLRILNDIKNGDLPELSELERTRLSNPFRIPGEDFSTVIKLLSKSKKLLKVRDYLNPDEAEGYFTPILENIPKLALHGFTPEELKEILLIVVGHTTMSRIVFGKLPAKSLKPITDRVRQIGAQKSMDLLRVFRLMSMAEVAAAIGEGFTGAQARELFRLYDDAICVSTDPLLDWDRLHDLRISGLGGVQNKAVREMLKFFNLFEFLDNWQEFFRKGAFEKEVFCDYQQEKLALLEEALDLARMAEQFKQEFMASYVFGQSYFFRQFLDTEFHGTGHLFPKLGTRAGFMLVWIAVNSSERHIVNFNPMLAGIHADRRESRIQKIKDRLLRIPPDKLHPGFFEDVKRTVREGQPAFIYDSGLRVMLQPQTRAIDVSFVDLEENIQQIDALLTHFESQKLRGISLKNLQELERRFSELESFHQYLRREGCMFHCDLLESADNIAAKDQKIDEIGGRLRYILQGQVFLPEEVFDTVSTLAKHCPEILRFFLPEFHAYGNLVENLPTRERRSLGGYVMRCLEKFQALVIKDRNAFQNQTIFYQLAKKEFGPLAEEGIGATHAQLDVLEYLVERIQQQPFLYQAMTLALLFQEIGRIEAYAAQLGDAARFWTNPQRGAAILEKLRILKKYRLDPRVERLVILLVRHHDLLGRVIHGDDTMEVLARLTARGDEHLLEVFVLHSILSSASEREGHMVSDFFDAFLGLRATCLQIMHCDGAWEPCMRGMVKELAASAQDSLGLLPPEFQEEAPVLLEVMGASTEIPADPSLWKGMQAEAFERLLKLLGNPWIGCSDVALALMKRPVNFIYHKRKLKSIGSQRFEEQLEKALLVYETLQTLTPHIRFYLFQCLSALGCGFRLRHFRTLPMSLSVEESIKVLIIAFQAAHFHFGLNKKGVLIDFEDLGRHIERRREVFRNALADFTLPESFHDGGKACLKPGFVEEIGFDVSVKDSAVRVTYHDSIRFDAMVQSLESMVDFDALTRRHQDLLRELREELPFDTECFQMELSEVYERQKRKICEDVLRTFQSSLNAASRFEEYMRIQEDFTARGLDKLLSDDQLFLLKEMSEFHLSRIRDHYLDVIYRTLGELSSGKDLTAYWNRLKYELFTFRGFVGKEYEALIARFFDEKMAEL